MAQRSYGHASDQISNLKDKATEQFCKIADQTEGVATRLAEQGREVGERMQEMSGNMKRTPDTSLQDQPLAHIGDGRRRWLFHRRDLEVVTSNERRRRLHKTGEGGGKRLRPQYVGRTLVRDGAQICLGCHISAAGAVLQLCVQLLDGGGRPRLDRRHRNHCCFSQTTGRRDLTGRGTRHAETSDRDRVSKRFCSALLAVNHTAGVSGRKALNDSAKPGMTCHARMSPLRRRAEPPACTAAPSRARFFSAPQSTLPVVAFASSSRAQRTASAVCSVELSGRLNDIQPRQAPGNV